MKKPLILIPLLVLGLVSLGFYYWVLRTPSEPVIQDQKIADSWGEEKDLDLLDNPKTPERAKFSAVLRLIQNKSPSAITHLQLYVDKNNLNSGEIRRIGRTLQLGHPALKEILVILESQSATSTTNTFAFVELFKRIDPKKYRQKVETLARSTQSPLKTQLLILKSEFDKLSSAEIDFLFLETLNTKLDLRTRRKALQFLVRTQETRERAYRLAAQIIQSGENVSLKVSAYKELEVHKHEFLEDRKIFDTLLSRLSTQNQQRQLIQSLRFRCRSDRSDIVASLKTHENEQIRNLVRLLQDDIDSRDPCQK